MSLKQVLQCLVFWRVSSVAAGIVTGIETKTSMRCLSLPCLQVVKVSNGERLPNFSGGISGANALYGAARNGLTMNQAAIIKRE
jgi:hypothetical protein